MGVGLRLFKLLEHDLQLIDLKIALQSDPDELSDSEQELISLVKKAQRLEDEADTILEEADHHQAVHDYFTASTEPSDEGLPVDAQLAELRSLIQKLHKSAKATVSNFGIDLQMILRILLYIDSLIDSKNVVLQKGAARKVRDEVAQKAKSIGGACQQKLESCLQDLHVKQQAYHSQSFVGNHIHRMREVNFYTLFLIFLWQQFTSLKP